MPGNRLSSFFSYIEFCLPGVFDLQQRGNNRVKIEPPVAYYHRFGILHAAAGSGCIPQMHLLQPRVALANSFSRVFASTKAVAHVEAEADRRS